jgi:hypothetical protein
MNDVHTIAIQALWPPLEGGAGEVSSALSWTLTYCVNDSLPPLGGAALTTGGDAETLDGRGVETGSASDDWSPEGAGASYSPSPLAGLDDTAGAAAVEEAEGDDTDPAGATGPAPPWYTGGPGKTNWL